jgi:hypothetical protein
VNDAVEMAKRAQLGSAVAQAFMSATVTDTGRERRRALDLLRDESARHALLRARSIDDSAEHHVPRMRPVVEQGTSTHSGGAVEVARTAAIPPAPAKPQELPWKSVDALRLSLEPAPGRRRLDLVIRDANCPSATEARISGGSAPHLAKMVMEQPDQDHGWGDLLDEGHRKGLFRAGEPESLERTGRRIRKLLPKGLRHRWQQSGAGVRWDTY